MTGDIPQTHEPSDSQMSVIGDMHINDLVESAPDTSPVLAKFGLELCCDDEHSVEEALELRGIDSEPVIRELASIATPPMP